MDGRSATPESRVLLHPVGRTSLWNPAVSLAACRHVPSDQRPVISSAPPPVAHQTTSAPGHLNRLHLSSPHLPPPPPAHCLSRDMAASDVSALTRGYSRNSSVANKAEHQQSLAPPHIYSTIGAYPANGRSSGHLQHVVAKSNFMNVDSLISKSSAPSSPLSRGPGESKSKNSVPLSRGLEKQPVAAPVSAATLPGQWTAGKSFLSPALHFAQPPATTYSLPLILQPSFQQRTRAQPDKKRSPAFESVTSAPSRIGYPHPNNLSSAVAEVTFAHTFNERSSHVLPHHHQPHPHHPLPQHLPVLLNPLFQHHSSPPPHHLLPLYAATSHQTSPHQQLPPHLQNSLMHHVSDQRSLVSHQPPPVVSSSRCDISSRSTACDNNNCTPLALKSEKQSRLEPQLPPDAGLATSSQHMNNKRKDVNENSSEVPCSSVSPTNSTTSSSNSNSGGGSKFLPKKMWIHKYTNQDDPTGGPVLPDKNCSPDDLLKENGLIHSNDNSSASNSHNSSSGSSNNSTVAAAGSSSAASKAKDGKEKVNGASKKKPLSEKKRLKGEAIDSVDGSDSEPSEHDKSSGEKGRKKVPAATKGQKRAPSAPSGRENKSKKTKGDTDSSKTPDGTCDSVVTAVVSHLHVSSDTADKSADNNKCRNGNKKQSQQVNRNNEDSERTEDEDDEQKQEEEKSAAAAATAPSSSSSPSPCEPASKQKRGRKPKSGSSPAGKRSPSNSSIASSTCVSKKEKSPKSKGSDKKCKSNSSCDSIDKSGLPFLQNKSCSELSPKSSALLPKCRECKMTAYQKIKKDVGPSIFCRFYQFRKLVFDKELRAAGFSEPKDAKDEDLKLWMPPERGSEVLKEAEARFLIDFVGDHFCNLVSQETRALALHMGTPSKTGGPVAWKSVVAGVREMCDVCETTLFNIHWVCSDCGFVVCIDCYRTRRDEESVQAKENRSKQTHNKSCNNNIQNIKAEKSGSPDSSETLPTPPAAASPLLAIPPPPTPTARNHTRDRDRYDWLYCNSKQPHLQEKLMLTQIVSKTALWDVCKRLHEVKRKMGCPCTCDSASEVFMKRYRSENKSLKAKDLNGCMESQQLAKAEAGEAGSASSPLTILADVAINSCGSKPELDQVINTSAEKEEEAENEDEECTDKSASALRDLLSKGASSCSKHLAEAGKGKVSSDLQQQQAAAPQKEADGTITGPASVKKRGKKPPPILSTQLNGVVRSSDAERSETSLQFFSRRITPIFTSKNAAPRVSSLEETKKQFPDIKHEWYCDGRLLVLKDTGNETPHKYLQLFEQQWLRHQPVVVCKVNEWLERHLWLPSVFKNKFAETNSDLIDCESREVIRDQPLKKYWEGFENLKARAKDKDGRTLIYKLKDWPPGEEFSEALPDQFGDLMSSIPMPEYTTHEGSRNLAGRLPRSFGLVPDLGPKMYTAYGMASDEKGTTNLHLDMSDAVNVMVYVGVFKAKEDEKEHQKNVLKALEEVEVEKSQLIRVRREKEKVGALWHIYDARDADKIRDMLNCFALEQGKKLHLHHDPIHDQSFYLDAKLRRRLKDTYNVVGYSIVQFHGDAVFIPAGAPHQVRNLSSCIKVAEDFVSPENVAHCFNLTEEFRQLSQAHDNHEDKLQIKNIIFHAVKDALAAFPDEVPARSLLND